MALPPDALDQLLERLEARDRTGAVGLVRGFRSGGIAAPELIEGLLAPALRRIGELWQLDEWDVAREHVATGIVDVILAELELQTEPTQLRGDVAVVCAEGEWHAMPARMVAEQLRHRGWAVTFLGASVPAPDLERFVRTARPIAVVVSCSMPTRLGGAQRSIEAAHRAGVPVLAGGAGFGGDAGRAATVGADAWAPSVDDADRVLAAWSTGTPTLATPRGRGSGLALDAVRGEVVGEALATVATWSDASPQLRSELDTILEFVEAALLTGDATVVDDHLRWLDAVLTARGVPAQVGTAGLLALADALPPDMADARRLLAAAAERAGG